VEFRVLGPLEVWDAGRRVAVGGPQARKVLAALLVAGGAVVGVGELVDVLWDGEPPRTATHQLHKIVAGLRGRLPGMIETDGPGYRIRLGGAVLDLASFDALAGAGSLAAVAGSGGAVAGSGAAAAGSGAAAAAGSGAAGGVAAAERLAAALALWRGPALAGVDSRALRGVAARLEERRLAAVEAAVELRLAAGEAAALVAELSGLVAAHPLRETPRRQLMVALYRCGRQADALAVYAQARALLADELGVDPGPDLARAHQQVLRADPALWPPAAVAAAGLPPAGLPPAGLPPAGLPPAGLPPAGLPPAGPAAAGSAAAGPAAAGATATGSAAARPVTAGAAGIAPAGSVAAPAAATWPGSGAHPVAPCTLPYDLPDFAGRGGELARLLVPGPGAMVITAIDGMAGVGKTALAVHAAHRLADRYPDGRLFCDLHAHTAGAPAVTAEAALERLLRMLGVPPDAIPADLDGRAARWRAELAGRRALVVLDNATSAAQVRPLLPGAPGCLVLVTSRRRLGVLDGAAVLSLDVLPPADAAALFAAIAGAGRAAAEPAAVTEVAALCGRLPLAIRIAATRLAHRPQWTVSELAGRLRAEPGRLAELTLTDRGVSSAFSLSYAQLRAAEQRMFRLLGLHPGADFDPYSAAALAGTTPAGAGAILESLVDAHLLQGLGAGRYRFHDLLRDYARDLAPAGAAAGRRLRDYFLAAATAATDLVNPGARRFEPDLAAAPEHLPPLPDLDAALRWLTAEHGTLVALARADRSWHFAAVLRGYFEHRGHFTDWRATAEAALPAADCPLGTVLLRFGLGALAMWTGRLAEGMNHFRHALAAAAGDPDLAAAALTSLGMLAHLANRDREAAGYLRRALATGDGRIEPLARNNLGLAEARLGRGEAAVELHRQALDQARRAGNAAAVRAVLLGLGETSLRLGLPAEQPFAEALRLARAGRFRMQEALALDGLAHATGTAARWWEALAILTDLRVTDRADLVRRHLADPAGRCCDLCRATPAAEVARPA
jgi:DNA-binding SARP family transcriptional activator/tetratricopeptide (TPR) repeat protein